VLEWWETKVGNFSVYPSSSVAYCEITYEKGSIEGTNRCSWTSENNNHLNKKASVNVGCLKNQFISHDL
jgi:hypothetical protein